MQISTDMCKSEPGCPLSMHLRKAIIAIGLLREVDVIGFLAAMHVFARLTTCEGLRLRATYHGATF